MNWKKKNILVVIIIGFGLMFWFMHLPVDTTNKDIPTHFIVANPFDLTQIQGFSKYRSCEGHDYRAPDMHGKTEKTPRSMKHYVQVKPEYRGSTGKVDVFAPFEGKISDIKREGTSIDRQVWLTPNTRSLSGWQFIFFHIVLDQGLQKENTVRVGQHIGTAYLARGPDGATDNFDIALKYTKPFGKPAIEPPFSHMTQNVLNEYEKYGISIRDLIISKETRDADPCPLSSDKNGPDVMFLSGTGKNEFVFLQPIIY